MSSLFESLPQPHAANEAALSRKILAGDTDALNTLVMQNMREAVIYTRGMARGLDEGELVSICFETLVRNAKRFDPTRQRFFAFAKAGLRGALYRNYNKTKRLGGDCAPPFQAQKTPACISSDGPSGYAGMPEYEVVADENVVQPDMEGIFTRDRWELVKPVVEQKCNEQERMVLTLTYEGGLNFQESGDLLGVTRSAVQRTHWRAVKKLRTELTRRRQLFT